LVGAAGTSIALAGLVGFGTWTVFRLRGAERAVETEVVRSASRLGAIAAV